MNRTVAVRSAAEVIGTALLVAIGTGTIVAAARVGGIPQWSMAVAWFMAVLVPILLFVRISGAHLNPVVTLALAASRRFPVREVPPYLVGQIGGAFLGSAVVRVVLGSGSHLGATVPGATSLAVVFVGEAGFTALLVGSVFLLSYLGAGRRRWRLLLPPFAVGLSTWVIGPLTGSSLNPARTLAPAVLSGTYTVLWLYFLAVLVGGLLAAVSGRALSTIRDCRRSMRERQVS